MSCAHPLFLVLAIVPLAWMIFAWRTTASRSGLVLKALSLAAIALAFAEPAIILPNQKTGLVVLVDTSQSVSGSDLDRASAIASQLERTRGANWMEVIPFAARVRALESNEISGGVHLVNTSGDAGSGTNLEAALADSLAAVPAGYIPRVLLISDGNENEGSAARAIAELQAVHVPVDTISLAGRSATGLRLESVSMPQQAYAGEEIPIDLTISSPSTLTAAVHLSAERKGLGSSSIRIEKGLTLVRIHARVNTSGATAISGKISAGSAGELQFEEAIELKRAKVLFLSQDPPGVDGNFLQALKHAGLEVTRDMKLLNKDLPGVQLVVLNNLDLKAFSRDRKQAIEQYVRNGGGLLLIGGEHQVYKPDKQMDALDRALPAKLAPPETPQGTTVALIIDKSSSMEGRKIELARLSAIGVVNHLRPMDMIGVLIFDNSYEWAVPMRRAVDKGLIDRLISGITPDGGTQIAPALTEAYHKVLPSTATYKHIVLLTDGISEEGDSIELAREAANHDVTISTVGLGQDVNRSYLEKIASSSGGRSYFLNDPQGLEQILLRDVQDYSGSTAVEKPLTPLVMQQAEILDGTGMEAAPPLRGYARYTAKPGAETILGIDAARKDPLYVRWQYGLGRAAVFTSDAKSRWAAGWIGWPGFDKFWINVARDLLTRTPQTETSAQYDSANGNIDVTYRLTDALPGRAAAPRIFVIGPHGFEQPLRLQQASARVFRGLVHIGRASGFFRIRPLADSPSFPEIGFYRRLPEADDYGANEALLAQISRATGGRSNPPITSLFDAGGRFMYSSWRLWPMLLALAIALTLAELIARKWGGLARLFRR